jgi:hypothetical protein
MTTLTLQIREQEDRTAHFGMLALSPDVSEDYWAYRVQVSKYQAVVGFPKFSTIGIGFQIEDAYSTNTNLPYTVAAEDIAKHIWRNKGPSLRRKQHYERVTNAIRMIQAQAMVDLLVPERAALRQTIDRLRAGAR